MTAPGHDHGASPASDGAAASMRGGLVEFATRRRVTIAMCTVTLLLFGLIFWVVLGIDTRFQPFTTLLINHILLAGQEIARGSLRVNGTELTEGDGARIRDDARRVSPEPIELGGGA